MKKLLLAGCSHSVGVGLKQEEKHWGKLIAEKVGYQLVNIAKAGSSLQYSTQGVINYVLDNEVDTVVLQLTTFDRYPIPCDGEKRFLTNSILSKDIDNPDLFHLLPANYLQSIDNQKFPVPKEVIRFFYEKITFSTFYLNTLINELALIQNLLNSRGIRFIVIPYDDYFWGTESQISIWKYPRSSKLKFDEYIQVPFMKWLRDNYNDKDYYIDNGFHLNSEGHRLFAEEYIPSYINL